MRPRGALVLIYVGWVLIEMTLELQAEAFSVLASKDLWKGEEARAEAGELAHRMWKAAELCASSGAHGPAVQLLKLESAHARLGSHPQAKTMT